MAHAATLASTVSRTVLRTVVGCVVGLALGAVVLTVALGPGMWHDMARGDQGLRTTWLEGTRPAVVEESPRESRIQQRVARLSAQRGCSRSGFGGAVIPASALVEAQGRVRVVSFDEGWAVHQGERPGRLLAVCLR